MNGYNLLAVVQRELRGYFTTPIAYVFIVIFLFLSGALTFHIGAFYERGQADLEPFFRFHPWLYLFLIPAITMRLWAEERKTGTIELLLTLPISTADAVLGKFFAAWVFTATALVLTFPMWISVNYLGDPDNAVIATSYLGSVLAAGAFLAVGSCVSALTKSQVIAFVISAVVCFLLMMSGFSLVIDFIQGWMPQLLIEAVSSFSLLTHFNSISKGVIDVRDIVYFISLTALFLYTNVVVVDITRGE